MLSGQSRSNDIAAVSRSDTQCKTQRVLLLRGARQVITLRGDGQLKRGRQLLQLEIIENGAVVITGERIAQVGPARRLENLAEVKRATVIDLEGRIILPGFIDSHVTLFLDPAIYEAKTTEAGQLDTVCPSSLKSTSWIPRSAVLPRSPRATESGTRRQLSLFTRHGLTTIEARIETTMDFNRQWRFLEAIGRAAGSQLHLLPAIFCPSVEQFQPVASGCPWDGLPRGHRIQFFSVDLASEQHIRFLQGLLPFLARLHLQLKPAICSPVVLLPALELMRVHCTPGFDLSPDFFTCATTQDIDRALRQPSTAILYPVDWMLDKNLPALDLGQYLAEDSRTFALATGFHPVHNPTCNPIVALSAACRYFGLPPEAAINAAIYNLAHALGHATELGSIEAGKLANIVVLNATDYREISHYWGLNLTCAVFQKGKIVYAEEDFPWPENS